MLFKKASELGLQNIFLGEGPDEYLAGYTSYSILAHEERLYKQPELQHYTYTIDTYLGCKINRAAKILKVKVKDIEPYWNKYQNFMSKVGYCDLMVRGIKEMEMAMAKRFEINVIYPYMNQKIESFCFEEIPDDIKIKKFTGKWPMRKIAEKFLPKDIVWRKNKMGGPVAPVGLWLNQYNEFDKTQYIAMQKQILGISN